MLTPAEKILLIKYAIKIANSRIKIFAGVSYASVNSACEFVAELNNISALDGILVVTPYYVKPSQAGLYEYFKTIALLSKVPLILYNVPGRTGCDLADDTTLRLAEDFKNIIGLKDSSGNITRCSYLVKHRPKNFMLYTGEDGLGLPFMFCGGNGIISVVGNIAPRELSNMCSKVIQGNNSQAIEINNKILELHSLMFIEGNPIPVKWALYKMGIIKTPYMRCPLTILTKANQKKLTPFIQKLGFGTTYAKI